jgi:serine/threonine protein kinase
MPADTSCPAGPQLEAFALGAAPAPKAEQIKEHLAGCTRCRAVVEGFTTRRLDAGSLSTGRGGASVPDTNSRASGPPDTNFPFLQPPLEPGEIGRLGNYRVLELLGRGGMGLVFRAEDLGLHRAVALKVMRPELHGDPGGGERFLREARTMAALKHDHLVTIYFAGSEGDIVYFAMELLDGETLHAWLARGERPAISEILRLGREITAGLAVLHERGLVHRDLKPANIWREAPGGRIKLLDLGLTRQAAPAVGLTAAGDILGTPGYMAPEQARGDPVDARSDLFSLGCVLYRLCTGRGPFPGETAAAVLMSLAADKPTPVRTVNPDIPEALADLVGRLLEKRVRKRPESAAAVLVELERIERHPEETPTTPIKRSGVAPRGAAVASTKLSVAVADQSDETRDRTFELSRASGRRRRRRPRRVWIMPVALGVAGLGLCLVIGAVLVLPGLLTRPPASSAPQQTSPGPAAQQAFLSEWPPLATENWPLRPPPKGPKDKDKGKDKDKDKDKQPPGKEVWVKGKLSAHGIYMHPPFPPLEGQPASVSYDLGGQWQTFAAEITVNDGPGQPENPCVFWVYGDDKVLWKSNPVRSQDHAQLCRVAVQGVKVLRLAVTCEGPPRGAHAVWVEPRVEK